MSIFQDGFRAKAATLGLLLSIAIVPAFAQTTTNQPTLLQKPEETIDTTTETETTAAPELSAEAKELDPFLLGPWSRMTASPNDPLNGSVIQNAIIKCRTEMQLSRLKFSPDVVRTFPENRRELVGDTVFFRTSKGIQRLDNRTDTMLLLPTIKRATNRDGDVIWQLSNKRYRVFLRFTDTKKRGGTGEFMATNDGIYIRCIKRPEIAE